MFWGDTLTLTILFQVQRQPLKKSRRKLSVLTLYFLRAMLRFQRIGNPSDLAGNALTAKWEHVRVAPRDMPVVNDI